MDNKILETIKEFKPISIFVYGSQASQSTNGKSDYEIGIIFDEKNYVNRKEIQRHIQDKNYNVFPFKLNEVQNGTIDTPFQKNIYLASMISGNAKTIYGEEIIEQLPMPKISKQDLLMDTSFNLGYALSAVRLMKENLLELAEEFFYKSMFYATRNLYFVKFKKVLSGYNNIFAHSKKLDMPQEYRELLEIGNKLRNEQSVEFDKSLYYKNISYINKFVISEIEKIEE